jgi:hypothetical protein
MFLRRMEIMIGEDNIQYNYVYTLMEVMDESIRSIITAGIIQRSLIRLKDLENVGVNNCIICHEMKECIKTECGHIFCSECLTRWRQRSNECPYCRTKNTFFGKKTKKN